jgi:hypothetical protein
MRLEDYVIEVSTWVIEKLALRGISLLEVEEAICNFSGKVKEQRKPPHKTIPPTYFIISETFDGKILKIAFILDQSMKVMTIKTAYEPSEEELQHEFN